MEKVIGILADVNIDTKTTHEGISVASQTAVALKREFGTLLDKIDMTLGKLNVIEQQAKDIKTNVAETQNPTKEIQQHSSRTRTEIIEIVQEQISLSSQTSNSTENNQYGKGQRRQR